MKRTETY